MDIDGLRDKLEDLAGEHADQLEKGIAEAERLAKKNVGGHDKQIDQAAGALRGFLADAEKEQHPAAAGKDKPAKKAAGRPTAQPARRPGQRPPRRPAG